MTDFNEIYSLYFRDVYKYVLSISRDEMIAEEITQETFFKALKNIDKFDGKCKLYVWLCQIAKNTFFTYRKKEKYHEDLTEAENILVESTIEQSLLSKESVFNIHKELHRLDEPYKEVFMLRVFGDLSFSQIGSLFEKTESWARVTYHRAKMKLKERMECE
ncbi:MAG: RNA polymerase sigma factor [Lachnospiraceae bacterium]|uniref:RNA polymerase sigma factor n=1 Tax=Clostridium sp. WB02_MRS01 TaxID=2605777 RepID=UPI001324D37A|nr:RNA polymerase sigma factor [Lachnospiraceae bacterium]MSS09437.1 RNA polymerase sigma factor [Clostridium sp. WB02_MRS01]